MLWWLFLTEKNVFRFISHEFRYREYEQMLQDMSAKASISPELVRKYTKKALTNWEKKSGQDVLTLFTTTPTQRRWEIDKMIADLRDHLRPIVFSQKKLDQVMEIATDSIENMYWIY